MSADIIKILEKFSALNIDSMKYSNKEFNLELKKNNSCDSIENSEYSKEKLINECIENKIIQENSETEKIKEDYLYKLKSPIVGIFYSKASPDSKAFVDVGAEVKKGDVLCIIEAMKMFNEIKSPVDGIIRKINFEDEQLIAFDDIIFEIEEKC
ncbi:biotin/lipoyl-containing protein [Peptoniphilus sp. oral taxon 386]|uniref:acetyl-CoA carboxylase biotin carboxyl carrier protein n=1 Tax=Peptoniphilus sp. oral taxon 386 TaxID=652713 RepID=UPI0001DA9D01|nr:biotin/lipoyl-containing protein [Peptoniphilus sp. oral taxon 386]EFI42473.1 putative acetyl-CoA carboxylase, biotin carboxyl carrier protein [Peptoniphilus sp. oral taxon 386 str. F0131]